MFVVYLIVSRCASENRLRPAPTPKSSRQGEAIRGEVGPALFSVVEAQPVFDVLTFESGCVAGDVDSRNWPAIA